MQSFSPNLDISEIFHADLKILSLVILGALDPEAFNQVTNDFAAFGLGK